MNLTDFQKRIKIVNNYVIVQYFDTKDLNIPWWKLWITKNDECEMTNKLNKELYEDVKKFAKENKYIPPGPPLRWVV